MSEITGTVTVYNSIINNLNDKKLDSRAPFSLIEFLNNTGELSKSISELENYNIYLQQWQKTANVSLSSINSDLKTQFVSFLSEVKLLYSNEEERRFLENINLQDDEQLSIAIPFFAKKIKDISIYFSKKRKELTRDIRNIKSKGSGDGLKNSIKKELLDLYSGDDAADGLAIPENIGEFIDGLSVEIENQYDTYNDYYDLDPTKAPNFYDSASENRTTYLTTNTNTISGTFYYDTEKAIRDIINTQGISLKEISNILVEYDTTDISGLPGTFFTDYKNTNQSSDLKYLLQAELVQKFMGTDMYYISSNSSNEVLSGKMFDAAYPYRNLLNINNASTVTIPGGEYKSEKEVGLFFKPTNHGILKLDASFEPVIDRTSITSDSVYIFPDPNRYGNVEGLGGSSRSTPFIFVLKNKEFKNNSSSFGKSLVKSNSDNNNFYSYSSLEQDNFKQDNIAPFYGLESSNLSGNILKEVGDIYGNIFFLINETNIANRNLNNTTFADPPLGFGKTEYTVLSTDVKKGIITKRRENKKILLFNTVKDSYESINNALSGVFKKYLYDSTIYSQLTGGIKDIDIFKNTFYIRTANYSIIDNIVYNTDGTFNSKVFVSRVKQINPDITIQQNRKQLINISNPIRLGNEIFTIKCSSDITTSPLNNRVFNFSIYKLNLDTQTEVAILDEKTTNRSYFSQNFSFDTGTNIVQIKDIKLTYNKKQNKFFLLTNLCDLNGASIFHVLVFEINGNNLNLHLNYLITPDNYNKTSNFYKRSESANYTIDSLTTTPTQKAENGSLIL